MELNQQQVQAWLRTTLAAGGPIAALILSKSGISAADYAIYVEIVLIFAPGIIVAVWAWFSNRKSSQVANIAAMPAEDQRAALDKTTDSAKVRIAQAVPNVASIVVRDAAPPTSGLAKMAASDDNPKVVSETQNTLDALSGSKLQGATP